MGASFYLNLDICTILGHEDNKSEQCIESIIKGIQLGDTFPPVHVFYVGDLIFSISGYHFVDTLEKHKVTDGGHHRTIAHYIERKPLLCKYKPKLMVIPGLPGHPEQVGTKPISDIVIVDNLEEYIHKKNIFGKYR